MRSCTPKLRVLGVAFLASLGLMSALAAGAQAQGTAGKFLINGSSASLKASFTAEKEGLWIQLLVEKRGINIKCKELTVKIGSIENSEDGLSEIDLDGCLVFAHSSDATLSVCIVRSTGKANGEIIGSALLLPRLHSGNFYVLFEHKTLLDSTLHPMAIIEIVGPACAVKGTYTLKGSVVGQVTENNAKRILLSFSEAIQKLVGDEPDFGFFDSFINASVLVELTGPHAGMPLGVH